MVLEFLLIVFGMVFSFLFFYTCRKQEELKKEHKRVKKWLYGELTDFEKLAYIINLYCQIDFDKLRPDQIKLWKDWIAKNLK